MLLLVIITTSVNQYNSYQNASTITAAIHCLTIKFLYTYIRNRVSDFAVNADSDISTNRNVTINMTSISSYGYERLSAIVSAEMLPCHSRYIFDTTV